MALGSCAQQSPCNNFPANPIEEQNELAGPQGLAKRSNASNDKAFIPLKASIPLFVSLTKDFFTKFIKVFMEST